MSAVFPSGNLFSTGSADMDHLVFMGCLLLAIGLIFYGICLLLFALSRKNYGKAAEGIVADLVKTTKREYERAYERFDPVIEYSLIGNTYRVKLPLKAEPGAYHIGEKLSLRVSERKPARVYIVGDDRRFVRAYSLIGIGLLFLAIALSNYFKGKS